MRTTWVPVSRHPNGDMVPSRPSSPFGSASSVSVRLTTTRMLDMDCWMASRTRADSTGGEPSGPRDATHSSHARWAHCLTQVYEADPLLCLRCGGTMTVIAVIEQLAVIRQIRSADLVTKSRPPRPPPPERRASERPPTRPRAWQVTTPASGPTTRSLTCLCVARRQATSPAPIQPARSGKADGLLCSARRRARAGPRTSA